MSDERSAWLATVADRLRPTFAGLGHPLPERLRIAVASGGIYSGGGQVPAKLSAKGCSVMGHCTNPHPETGEVFITISALAKDPAETLVHELVHAAVGMAKKHGKEFAQLAGKLGLRRPWTATTAGPRLHALMQPILADLGQCPTADLMPEPVDLPAALEGAAAAIRAKLTILTAAANGLSKAVGAGARRGDEAVPDELATVLVDTGRLLLAARDHIESANDWMTWCLRNLPVSYPFAAKMMEWAEARA